MTDVCVEPLRSLDWQAHVYGDVEKISKRACRELHLPLRAFAWSDGGALQIYRARRRDSVLVVGHGRIG